tara:strand:+ start:2519 stop:2800 length:282 start_codon:yes stop_codon:yes gene_type:complete
MRAIGSLFILTIIAGCATVQFPAYEVKSAGTSLIVSFDRPVTVRVHDCSTPTSWAQHHIDGNHSETVLIAKGQYLRGQLTPGKWATITDANNC